MKKFKQLNLITGWLVFLIAAITYFLTIEPTTSFWDCGEFITTGFKMEVGHPPGAPFFMILSRFFTLFATDVSSVAMTVNLMSALASAFTIVFLFWSVTHIAKRIIVKTNTLPDIGQTIAILGTGAVAALAYTFSDSFWFSAVEGEVYATSSLFTAVVFWAILKWENEADQKYANRWLILIAYLMGLSIGVHLLNLLTIPAVVFVYYFRKYEITTTGIFKAAALSVGLLAFIMYGVITGIVVLGSKFELFFANTLGLGFDIGFFFFLFLLIGGIVFGVYYTYKKQHPIFNTIFTSLLVILIGYSSFALIIIRSVADTPMNQNSPDNVFGLISYLKREQYGSRPLMHGQYFNAPVTKYADGDPVYEKSEKDKRYNIIDHKLEREFDPEYTTLFPRMYSDQESPDHVQGYAMWTGNEEQEFYNARKDPDTGRPITDRYGELVLDKYSSKRPPTFFENVQFFFSYQLNYMYFRYFMWNFAGKQNDIQGHGGIKDGNWISGIKFLDEVRLGELDYLPDSEKNNKGKNKYYLLPFILGILGIFYMAGVNKTGNNYFWVIMLFFFFTGIAIVLYLNQPPYQPRERDYAYAASFYAFAVYIGFGVAAIYKFLTEKLPGKTAAITATLLGLMVPALMAQQNWDDHDRSNRYTATDYAKNYLNSCEKNSIIFTNGDNDTFPLWYVQEVEGYRTDVRVINLSYFNTEWYINQMRQKTYKSDIVPFSMSPEKYEKGKRDIVYAFDNPNVYLAEKYQASKYILEKEYEKIFANFIEISENSNFAEVFPKEAKSIKEKGHNSTSPIGFFKLTRQLSDENFIQSKGLNYTKQQMTEIYNSADAFLQKISKSPLPLNKLIEHIASNKKEDKTPLNDGRIVNYMPSTQFIIPVDKEKVKKSGYVAAKDSAKIVPAVSWDIKKSHIRKNEMMVLDLLASNNWERPVYFATTVGNSHYLSLEKYFQLEGLAYKVVPVKNTSGGSARVNTDILYENIMSKFKWGGLEKNPEKIYLDENNRRFLMNFKSSFRELTQALIKENKKDSAEKVLDKYTGLFSNEMSPYSYYDLLLGSMYYDIGKADKGNEIFDITLTNSKQNLIYFNSLKEKHLATVSEDFSRTLSIYQQAISILEQKNQKSMAMKYGKEFLNILDKKYNMKSTMLKLGEDEQQFYRWFTKLPAHQQHVAQIFMQLEKYY
ncbi:MAG: DUF2723 domain-containing protein [Bacteroidota bacterium]|nr:DUF2723 domain-containing protein [Bacteroidota bacterium]